MAKNIVSRDDGGGGLKKRYQEKTNRYIINDFDNSTPKTFQQQTVDMLEEAARKQRVVKYRKLMQDASNITTEVSSYCKELLELRGIVEKNFSGSEAKTLNDMIDGIYDQCKNTMDDLNNVTKNAAKKVMDEGEACTYDRVQIPTQTSNTKQKDTSFSCNTDALRLKVLPTLQKISEDLEKSADKAYKLPALRGCEDVKNIPNEIIGAKTKVTNSYNETLNFIEEVEKTEKENIGIIEKGLSLFGNLLNSFKGLFNKKNEPKYFPINNDRYPNFLKQQNDEKIKEKIGENYDIDTEGKTLNRVTNESMIIRLAQDSGIDTKNKPFETILDEVAQKRGIEKINKTKKVVTEEIETPSKPNTFDTFSEYVNGNKGSDTLLQKEELLNDRDYQFDGKYYWGEAFKSSGHYEEGRLVQDLNNGKQLVWKSGNKTCIIKGYSDGKLIIEDLNGGNTQNMDLKDFASMGGAYYSYSLKPEEPPKIKTITTTKTILTHKKEEDIMKEILEDAGLDYLSDTYEFKDTKLPKLKNDFFHKGYADDAFFDKHFKWPDLKDETDVNNKNTTDETQIQNTNSTKDVINDVPLLNQKDYRDVKYYYTGNLADSGCAIIVYSMALSYLLDDTENYTPEKLAKKYEGTYGGSWGTSPKIFRETPQDYGLEVEQVYAGEGFINSNKVEEALRNGSIVIAYVSDKSDFTSDGHYILLTGITEEGKIFVNDPNGDNYNKSKLKDGFGNGFAQKDFAKDTKSTYWIFPPKDTLQNENK